jgi:hypothetical protein
MIKNEEPHRLEANLWMFILINLTNDSRKLSLRSLQNIVVRQ